VALLLLVGLGFCWLLSGVEPIHTVEQYIAFKRAGVPPDQLELFETNLREHPPGHPLWLIVRGLPASVTINLLPALALEAGFRGFLFREMPGGFWARSLRIGALSGLYMAPSGHLPLRRYTGAGRRRAVRVLRGALPLARLPARARRLGHGGGAVLVHADHAHPHRARPRGRRAFALPALLRGWAASWPCCCCWPRSPPTTATWHRSG
jgi:hypothetical protein